MNNERRERQEPPFRINGILSGLVLAGALLQLAVIPLFVLPNAYLAAALLVLVAILTPLHSMLLHEAIHGRLIPTRGGNQMAGRILALISGVAFDVVRFGHLLHHGYNRHSLDRPDILSPDQNGFIGRIGYYAHLLGGVYAAEIGASILFFLPRATVRYLVERNFPETDAASAVVRSATIKAVIDARRAARIRIDTALFLLLYGAAFWLYGAYWPLLLAAVAVRGVIISLMDNAPHYGTPAVINAPARDMWLPRWAAAFLLNQNLHALHHSRPDLAWPDLKPAFATSGGQYQGSYIGAIMRQFRGPTTSAEAQTQD